MALQTLHSGVFFPAFFPSTVADWETSAETLDAAGEKYALIMPAPKTGSVTAIVWRTAGVTTGDTLDIRLETIDLSDGNPSGTLFGTDTNAAQVVGDGDDNILVTTTLTSPASVTKGDLLAIVIEAPVGYTGTMQITVSRFTSNMGFPYTRKNLTGTYQAMAESVVASLKYSDGSYGYIDGGQQLINTYSNPSFNNTSTPDVRGNRFTLPFPSRVDGVWIHADMDGDGVIKLYDSDGVTVLESVSVDKDVRSVSLGRILFFPFDTSVDLAKDTVYRIALEPSSATNVSVKEIGVEVAAQLDTWPGGQNVHFTSAKDPTGTGDWTDDTTRRAMIGIRLDAFDDGVGGGGGGTTAHVF